jgi:hypothetical protein
MYGARTSGLVFAGLVFTASAATAQEKKIDRKDLPPPVEQAVTRETRGATLLGFTQESEDGKMFYEVETRVAGRSRDILIDATGKVAEIEDAVVLARLSAAVQAGLKAAAGTGRITRVESITKQGKVVAYEAQVTAAGGKKSEVQVGPDGKALAHEE